MQLTHEFTVPVDRATAWAAFQDIGSVAECFPGAAVTSVEGDTFQGTAKVKLGPIALQYSGTGRFLERDEAAGRMLIEAKGRDKRGNGTAGANVTATFTDAGSGSTKVEVVTDLQITGKPAQFGRGVMQDVSDKLLGQFVDCLETKVTAEPPSVAGGEASAATEPPAVAEGAAPASADPPLAAEPPLAGDPPVDTAPPVPAAPRVTSVPPTSTPERPTDDALDLGATVLPVLLKSYGKQVGLGLLGLVLLSWWVRRRRR